MRHMMKVREPLYMMENIHEELNKLIRDAFGEFDNPEIPVERLDKTWRPAIEMCESDGKYLLKAELPGVGKDNIDVDISEDSITIKAETKSKEEVKKEHLYQSEFKYGKFLRTFSFPSKVNASQAKAEYKNGILTINVPKSEEERAKITKLQID